jgi:hypothetical protein
VSYALDGGLSCGQVATIGRGSQARGARFGRFPVQVKARRGCRRTQLLCRGARPVRLSILNWTSLSELSAHRFFCCEFFVLREEDQAAAAVT